MANIIEIRVRAANETKPIYDEIRAESAMEGRNASAAFSSAFATQLRGAGGSDMAQSLASSITGGTGSVHVDAGKEIGDEISDTISDTVGKDLPPKLKDPIEKSGATSGKAFTAAFSDNLGRSLSTSAIGGMGQKQGSSFSIGFGEGVKSSISEANLASIVDEAFTEATTDVLAPSSPAAEKIKENARKTGEQAGKNAGDGMSPLLTAAIVGGLSVGAPLILGAFGGIMSGISGLALRNNIVVKQDLADLGHEAGQAITQAAAPLAGTMHEALLGVEGTVKRLQPELSGLFINAEPDITAVAGGVEAFATNVLPGMSTALKNSQVIVSDLGNSLGGLGSGVGTMFQGLTRDAYTTGDGMQSLLGTVGHLAGTLGGVLGSAASVGSTALLGLDPVLNTTLTLIDKIDNAGTVGAAGGMFAAMKFDPSIKSGLDGAANSLSKYASTAVTAEGEATRLGRAASGVAGALEKGASVAGGPWGIAIGGAIGLAAGLVGALINASHASDALTLSQQGLQDAVAKDGGQIGQATAAYVAAQAQADGLAQSAADAGVSLDTWTQAVTGNKAAQDAVTASVRTTNQVIQNQKLATDEAAHASGKYSQELQDAETVSQAGAAATNQLTDKNKQLLASMQAQNQQIAAAVEKQAQLNAATNLLTNSTAIFSASLDASYQQMVAQSQQSALNTVAALDLGSANVALSQRLYDSVTAYNEATTGASAYATVLDSLDASTMSVDKAQNTLAQQMITAKSAFAQNKYSLDLNTQAGVNNRQALVAAATAIQKLGEAEYQQTGSLSGANKLMKDQETAFINATGATGKARTAIQQYIDEILKIPAQQTTKLTIIEDFGGGNTGGGRGTGGPTASKYATGGVVSVPAAATGGNRGGVIQANERGIELFRLQNGTTVIPHSNVESMAATGALSGARGGPVQLELIPSGGSALEQMIWDWLRGRIRAKGGSGTDSVQRALGQVA